MSRQQKEENHQEGRGNDQARLTENNKEKYHVGPGTVVLNQLGKMPVQVDNDIEDSGNKLHRRG